MKFNAFAWRLYARSERGKRVIRRFSRIAANRIEPKLRFYTFEFYDKYKADYAEPSLPVNVAKVVRDTASACAIGSMKEAHRFFEKALVKNGAPIRAADRRGRTSVVGIFGETAEDWYDYIAAVSLGLHWVHPEFFLPYEFRTKFSILEEIHSEFGIPLPPPPGKSDKAGRSTYYMAINETWQEFRRMHSLSPAAMRAFLYDFAPQFISPLDATDLPSPSKAWLITGGSWDIEFVDSAGLKSVSYWGGNPAIRRGDILLMYLVRPRSCIDSVWRACSNGFVDPFFHYHGTVWITGRIRTPPIIFAELTAHPLLQTMSAVKSHFQGPSSKAAFTVEEYEAVLRMMERKGQAISALPRMPTWNRSLPVGLRCERDVESLLIEPFLKRLGYKNGDWIRQMPVRMGRGERNYPDYAIGPRNKRGEESARMILESKYQLSARSDFIDSFFQAKSYALRLQSRIMAMASREGVWAFPPHRGSFSIDHHVFSDWGELAHPDEFHRMLRLMGRDVVMA